MRDHRIELGFCGLAELGAAGREQDFGLEDKAVADDADIGAVADDLAQAAEELGTVARQLLHLARQRGVEAAPEIDDLALLFLGLGLGQLQRRNVSLSERSRRV